MTHRQQQAGNYAPSKYSVAYNSYSRSELKSVLPILRAVGRSCHVGYRFPIYKLLKAIAKIFLLNEVEGIFFAYMVRETNWDIRDRLITLNAEHVRDVVCLGTDQPEFRHLVLYLTLVMYSLKFFLNDDHQLLLEEAVRICPNFQPVFENWAKKYSHLTRRINPKTLNRVYQDLALRIRHEETDYNMVADGILQISPAYNPDKKEKGKEGKEGKERKAGREKQGEREKERETRDAIKMVKVEQCQIEQHNPMFSSSRLYEMAGAGLNMSDCSNFQVFGQMQKSGQLGVRFDGSVFGSSGMLNLPNFSLKDEEEYCEQLNLGLQEGESEENINLRESIGPAGGGLNLTRGASFSERFLHFPGGDCL